MPREGAWFADCAQIWLRSPPLLPSKSGHCFSSKAAQPGALFRLVQREGYKCEDEYWKCNWLDKPGHKIFLSPPLYFPRSSSCLLQSVEAISAQMLSQQEPVPTSWYWLWTLLGENIVEHKLCLDVLRPEAVNLCGSRPSELFVSKPKNDGLNNDILSAFAVEQVPHLRSFVFCWHLCCS